MAEYGEFKNLQAFLNYWNFTADKFEQQNDIYSRLTGAIIRDWVYDYTKEGAFLVENGDLDWLVKGSASDDQKLAAFDQWLGHNTANPAIVPAIQDYLIEHRQEIDQEVKDHQLTLDNVTDDSAERYMEVLEKINDQQVPSQELMMGWAGSYAIKQDGEWQIHGTHAALEELEADQVGYKFAGDLRDAPDDAPVHATPDILLAPEEMSVTTKQELMESAQEVLRNNDLPDTEYNCYSMAETILEATEWTHTGISAEEVSIDLRENPKNYNLDGMAERDAVDKYNERFAKLASHYGLLAAPYDEKTNYYTREVKTYLWLKDKSLRETDDRIIVADFDEIMNADANDTLDRLVMKKMAESARAIESSAEYDLDKDKIDERYQEIAKKIEHDLKTSPKVISYDMETTGFDPQNDDILQLSIVDGDGNELFNKLFKPTKKNEWPEAAAVNGITPERVQDCPAFQAWTGQVQEIFDQADVVVGYNQRNFDDRFLKANGIKIDPAKENHDLMLEFAEAIGEPNPYPKGFNKTPYKWQKLGQAADFYDYDWGNEHAHDSLADARATAYVYRQMNPERPMQPKEMAKQYLNYLHHAYPNYENAPVGISNSLSMLRDMSDYLYYEQRTPRYTPRQLQSMVRQGLEELKKQQERTQEVIYHDERVEAVKKLTLTDDASDRGGKAYADETAGDFMRTAFGNRADVDFKELNQALKESGIKPLAEPLAQQKIERAAKVLAKNYAQDQTSMAVAEYLQNPKRPMAQRLKVANNIIAARRTHAKPIFNSKKQTKER